MPCCGECHARRGFSGLLPHARPPRQLPFDSSFRDEIRDSTHENQTRTWARAPAARLPAQLGRSRSEYPTLAALPLLLESTRGGCLRACSYLRVGTISVRASSLRDALASRRSFAHRGRVLRG